MSCNFAFAVYNRGIIKKLGKFVEIIDNRVVLTYFRMSDENMELMSRIKAKEEIIRKLKLVKLHRTKVGIAYSVLYRSVPWQYREVFPL